MKINKMLLVSMVLLAILTLGVASAAENTVVNNLTTVDDGEIIDMDSPIDEIEVGGDTDSDDSSAEIISDDSSIDNAVDDDVKEVKDANPKLGASNDDVLGDEYTVITPENIWDISGVNLIPCGNYKFVGEFENSFNYLLIDEGCVIDGSEATFINMGVILLGYDQINGLTMISDRYLEDDDDVANGALLYMESENNIIDNLNLEYTPDEGHDVFGVLINDAIDFQITNSNITINAHNMADYYEYAMKIVGATGSNLLKGNTIIANLPILDVDYDRGSPGLDTDLVLNT